MSSGVFGTPENASEPQWWLWAPRELSWWIGLLFMIGSFCFILGSVMVLAGSSATVLMDMVFFVGSLFFTAAGYAQFHQSINAGAAQKASGSAPKRLWVAWQPGRIEYWVTLSQLLGTLMFNISTGHAFVYTGWLGYDLEVWVPDVRGSVLFLISGSLALFELCHGHPCWRQRDFGFWISAINFSGCVAFMISAILAVLRPNPVFADLAVYATLFTLIGALCFFVGAYLIWPAMSVESKPDA